MSKFLLLIAVLVVANVAWNLCRLVYYLFLLIRLPFLNEKRQDQEYAKWVLRDTDDYKDFDEELQDVLRNHDIRH